MLKIGLSSNKSANACLSLYIRNIYSNINAKTRNSTKFMWGQPT